ncbi:tripartite tricarboxylate transporter substrate binding protein [Phreatobacter stygius]|uniref:Tripartite tricarboxylate transporter substrate binding protein n=1 Tax=Phreatobacter stygius TaxID=1940610 RepID=A0A4D7B637_9HYPH|nr:tripartite tricarboxylate transporter substrate binding protein [Phreatobacter stygius]
MRQLVLAAACVAGLATSAAAQTFPSRPVTFIVPYAAGGTTDVLARIIAKAMTTTLGQSVIVENAGGAGATTGTLRVVRATADGYVLSFGNMGSLAANVPLYPNLAFDPRKDLAPIGVVARVPMVLSASNKSGIRDLKGFIERLKNQDNPLSIGQAGPGSTGHLAAARLLQLTETRATMVPYRGAGPAIADLIAGFVDGVVDQTVTMIPAHQGGNARALAVSSKARLPQIPDVPTFAEAGLPAFDLTVWNAIAAPKDTPPAVVARLAQALEAALASPEVQKTFAELAAEAPGAEDRGPEPLRRLIAAEVDRLTDLIRSAGIRVE